MLTRINEYEDSDGIEHVLVSYLTQVADISQEYQLTSTAINYLTVCLSVSNP
jgi:hypothetical protein